MKFKIEKIKMQDDLQAGDVEKVYSGFDGCRCGCNGKYSYSEAAQEAGVQLWGRDLDADDINQRMVNKVVKAINESKDEVEVVMFKDGEFYLELKNVSESTERLYGVYLLPTAEHKLAS